MAPLVILMKGGSMKLQIKHKCTLCLLQITDNLYLNDNRILIVHVTIRIIL